MMLRYSLNQNVAADRVESAVLKVLEQGHRTGDIAQPGQTVLGTEAMTQAVLSALKDNR
jgi:3-isopropylmalate dehydrogenase